MDQAKADQIVNELQLITRIIYSGQVPEFKPSATLLIKNIKPSELPFIRKDASGHALYYIAEGKAGVDIGQPERIQVPANRTVGEMSMMSAMLNMFGNLDALESRTADVYAEEPMRVIVFNYSALVEILKDPNPAFNRYRSNVLASLNRIMYRKLMDVNNNFMSVLINYGLIQEADEIKCPPQLTDDMSRFMKNLRMIPNLSIKPHELPGVIIREGEVNTSMVFIEEGRVKVSTIAKNEETGESEKMELDILLAPSMVGESSILNTGSISSAQVETLGRVIGYGIAIQTLLRHLQSYPDMFELFFKLLLEINYFRATHMMQKTASL